MKKIVDKLKKRIRIDKNLALFLIILTLIGVVVGSVFINIINESDKVLVNEHINNFLDNVANGQVNYFGVLKNNLISNIIFVILIWLLGISIIGLPIIVTMYFSKAFILGFSMGAIVSTLGFKGVLFSIVYAFPGQIGSLIIYLVLTMYAMSFSFKLISSIFSKKTLDFKTMINKYSVILLFSIIIVVLMNLYDSYLMPYLTKLIINIIR